MAMIVSHFGILESPVDPINFKKVIGAALLIMGAMVSVSWLLIVWNGYH